MSLLPRHTRLQRKTRLHSGGRLAPMSAAKRAIWPEYQAMIKTRLQAQITERGYTWCERCKRRCLPGPHHTQGRHGRNLLIFILICWNPCHVWINDHQAAARAEGFIL